jgi:hypothetical protein
MKICCRIAATLVCVVVAWTLMGCGTLFGNKHPEVAMGSDPDGAKVYVNGDLVGTTPVKIQLQNDKEYRVEFRKDGFQTKTYTLGKHVGAGWIILDILSGLIPVVIDVATGGWYELDSDNVRVILDKN